MQFKVGAVLFPGRFGVIANGSRHHPPSAKTFAMKMQRASGILAHITSLPSPFGIGDIGPASLAFIDFLVAAGQSYWQFLPTGPTEGVFDNSPYMSTSAFAGSPLLISPQWLLEDGLLDRVDLDPLPSFSPYSTQFVEVRRFKNELLHRAFQHFSPQTDHEYQAFCATSPWLDDYALYMTAKAQFGGKGWHEWPADLARRQPRALQAFSAQHQESIAYYRFEQYQFARQWRRLRDYAEQRSILLFGDLPIYVGGDSVDVWAHQAIFTLDPTTLQPTEVAGVPPDYFSRTGQRWGNPLYRWHDEDPAVRQALYAWWTARLAHIFTLVDMTRIDHFRGFESYWAIPAACETAIEGQWQPGPGLSFFEEMGKRLGPMEIVAEDLGIITPEVEVLRDQCGFPGMKVLQFAFDGNSANPFLPCNFTTPNCLVYTGTHDNDTTVGWFLSNQMDDRTRSLIKRTANGSLHDFKGIHHDLIYLAHSSIATLSILPLQDVLGFGNDCRMNIPGQATGNWRWRCAKEFLGEESASGLKAVTDLFARGRQKSQKNSLKK